MITTVLNEAELFVELNRLIYQTLDTRAKLLACSLRSGTQAIRALARSSAAGLARAAYELAELVRRLGGKPVRPLDTHAPAASFPAQGDPGRESVLLADCESAIAEIACRYRDTLEWPLPEAAQELLMRQFCIVIDDYQRIKGLRLSAEG